MLDKGTLYKTERSRKTTHEYLVAVMFWMNSLTLSVPPTPLVKSLAQKNYWHRALSVQVYHFASFVQLCISAKADAYLINITLMRI